tara:strand:- start:98 stop:1429 length:1332 start_codon:yes stop_codon:yes gene_type:complete
VHLETKGKKEESRTWFQYVCSLFGRIKPITKIKVSLVGPDTGNTRTFPIGSHTFTYNNKDGLNARTILCYKHEGATGVRFQVMSQRDIPIRDFILPLSGVQTSWSNVNVPVQGLSVRLRYGRFADKIVSASDLHKFLTDPRYEEKTLQLKGGEKCILQCHLAKNNTFSKKAVVWLIGRNDCFVHTHVANALFLEQGIDLYILNYRRNGMCRKRKFFSNKFLNSHCRSSNFDEYIEEIDQTLDVLRQRKYDTILGYAHSTGATILLNYVMHTSNEPFDGYIFNAPFLDWAFVGGDLLEFVLENGSTIGTHVKIIEPEFEFKKGSNTQNVWSTKIWSQYEFDPETRPLYYQVPVTAGFSAGATRVHRELCARKQVTSKPFLVLSSRGDDILKSEETTTRADHIGLCRTEVEFHHNRHDVYLSSEIEDVFAAILHTQTWLKQYHFI